jgi:hypothetical protein
LSFDLVYVKFAEFVVGAQFLTCGRVSRPILE